MCPKSDGGSRGGTEDFDLEEYLEAHLTEKAEEEARERKFLEEIQRELGADHPFVKDQEHLLRICGSYLLLVSIQGVRQKHVHHAVSSFSDKATETLMAGHELIGLLMQFPGRQSSTVLMSMSNALLRAWDIHHKVQRRGEVFLDRLEAEFPKDVGGPKAVSKKTWPDQYEFLMKHLAICWHADGRSLWGAEGKTFIESLCIVLWFLTGENRTSIPHQDSRMRKLRTLFEPRNSKP